MHSDFVINGICEQLKLIYDRIAKLANMTSGLLMDKRPDILDENEEMMVVELEQAQKLTLALTREILGADTSEGSNEYKPLEIPKNSDGDSAFVEGELVENLGDKTDGIGEKPLEEVAEAPPENKE